MLKVRTSSFDTVNFSSFKFPGGEVQVKLADDIPYDPRLLSIHAHLGSSDDVMELALLTDALRRRYPDVPIELTCPYLPYARQDRVCYPGEALSLKVFCDILNSLKFYKVFVWDAHSDVSLALLNNVTNVPQESFYPRVRDKMVQEGFSDPILVSPDAGAQKKIYETAKRFQLQVVKADKVRNPENGEITGTVVHSEPVGDKNFLIMDDICDGGRTFIELEKVLRPLTTGEVFLYVTHGIFSKGLEVLSPFDKIYVSNIFPRSSWFGKTGATTQLDTQFLKENERLVPLV